MWDTSTFIKAAQEKHCSIYLYEKCHYVNAKTKVIITCKIHGDFSQRPNAHLSGSGCKKCALEEIRQRKLRARITRNCGQCGTEFSFPKSEAKKGRKYCSEECGYLARTKKPTQKKCKNCNNIFEPKRVVSQLCELCSQEAKNKVTQAQAIIRFKEKHGDRFDYSVSIYTGMHNDITINCPWHGNFKTKPLQHLQGKICDKCKKIEGDLVKKFKQYVYENDLNNEEKYIIQFHQHWNNKVSCNECEKKFFYKKKSQNSAPSFCSKRCNLVHQGKIKAKKNVEAKKKEYSLTNINFQLNKLYGEKITAKRVNLGSTIRHHTLDCLCSKHGKFTITIEKLLEGSDCHFCMDRRMNRLRFLERIQDKQSILEKEYDYSLLTEFDDPAKDRQIFICKKHGKFDQTPVRHLSGDGCPKCAIEQRGKMNLERAASSWPENAKKVHGGKFDYSRAIYQGAQVNIEIICPDHGSFFQQPNNHINGAGCPSCADEVRNLGDTIHSLKKNNIQLEGSLYVIECIGENEHFYKIGITSQSVEKRFNTNVAMPYSFSKILDINIGLIHAYETEQRILKLLTEYAHKPQIYFAGETECLTVNPCEYDDELEYFLKYQKGYYD